MSKIDVIILGTSGAAPSSDRGLSSVAIRYNGSILLMDCGEGTQRQMLIYGLNISKVKHIFITHIHCDHVLGVAGLVRTLSLYGRTSPLNIYVPKGFESSIRSIIEFDKAIIRYQINVVGIGSGDVIREDGFTVRAFKLNHSVPAYGYAFREDDRIHFDEKRARALGVKGKMFSEIMKRKSKIINGKRVRLDEISERTPGRVIIYAADTRPSPSTIRVAANSDLLIHDSTFCDGEAKLAKERKHSTSREAATVAKRAKAKRLILTHISTRYRDTAQLLKEARSVFKNTDLADDGMLIQV